MQETASNDGHNMPNLFSYVRELQQARSTQASLDNHDWADGMTNLCRRNVSPIGPSLNSSDAMDAMDTVEIEWTITRIERRAMENG